MHTFKKLALTVAVGYAGLHSARTIIRHRRDFDFEGKRVVITGGSRGLGFVIARQLADQGARLAICARSSDQLNSAALELQQRGADVISEVCDVRLSTVRSMSPSLCNKCFLN